MDHDLIRALGKISGLQESQSASISAIKSELGEIKGSINSVILKIDGLTEKVIGNSHDIKFLEKNFDKSQENYGKEKEIIYKEIRKAKTEATVDAQKNITLKIYGALIMSAFALFMSFIKKIWP